MACLLMYLDRPDTDLLLSWLNDDEEIAFLVLAGRKVRRTRKLKRLLARGQGFTFYNVGGLSSLVHIENRWIAVKRLDALLDGHYTLWHVPSGPLPLLAENQRRGGRTAGSRRGVGPALTPRQALGMEDGVIEDPWSGWTESSPGADPSQPYFGPGHPGLIQLEVQTRQLLHLELGDDLVTVQRRVCARRE